jgi:chemotaxis methyl-accepting protein methylase/PAS domain-containing protein
MKARIKPARRREKPADVSPRTGEIVSTDRSFPIIGIGASAGGLEALESFFRNVKSDCGMAFVIVQHLDPKRKDHMSELLQRMTGMKVAQIKDRMPVQPNCVYVIPPNRNLSLLHGVLHLLDSAVTRGLRLPIDYFFSSLAQDQQEHSIGVILSGMGSDGTQGLRAIKEHAGVTLVQEPSTAKFDSMPRSAIDAGLADIIAEAENLPGKIIAHEQRAPLIARTEADVEGKLQSALEKVIVLLRTHSGNDFSFYKRNTLYRRIERRMGIHQISKMAAYVRYLQENSLELELLFKELLIGVTNFFRDPTAWDQLRTQGIPEMLEGRTRSPVLRAWVPGCSSGEEAYSLAIVFKEAIEASKLKRKYSIQIFATDLDRDSIDKARQGIYPATIAADVSKERLKSFFTKEGLGYRVRKDIREMVIFAPQNLLLEPPFTKLDILSCRNLLIYLTPEVQKKLIPLFHYSLTPEGILFQGSAETVGEFTDLFAPLSGKSRLYRRKDTVLRPEQVTFPSAFSAGPPMVTEARSTPKVTASLQSLADQLVLQRYAQPTVLTNDQGDICYISGRTGKYLEPAAGKANWNIFVMARDGLKYALVRAFPEALRLKESVTLGGLKISAGGIEQVVNVTVQRLEEPGPLQGLVMVVFLDVAAPVASRERDRSPKPHHPRGMRFAELERELLQFRNEARATHEEMQTSQEELRSANEELQSTNEELQSTNEEITTSKEEIHSMNEELQTVNAELQAKLDELSLASNDMKNLLDSTNIATLFLDKDLNVRRFTPQTTNVIKLIPADVGRPITDLATELRYPDLVNDAHEVLLKLAPIEKAIGARGDHWYTVRIMPYRTLDDRIDGVVITFADITESKMLEAKLRNQYASTDKSGSDESAKSSRKK